ncbi:class B sortase [Clostridium magnum]|uniref:Sortase family protein n=1 Tax=Clostridium magnum DSM 2767 TaxID=1121326 RepID=A0A162TJV5_9CLOT|nr:class B sortase [Clostridium magnum]KZL92737.1 sortase family protein [Clostridium magnum DSM 2767]SHI24863.1 sortase B [Clostridium magnum DSM 2767]
MKLKLKVFKKILFIMLLVVFTYSTIMTGYRFIDKYRNDKLNKNITTIHNEMKEESQEYKREQFMEPLLKINQDAVGWINIGNTRINYPVVQGKDNEYYLNHNIKKEASEYGSIFMDYRNQNLKNFFDTEKNIIIYGHHMKDGTMFGDLKLYKDEKFFNDNQIISFNILGQEYKWQIFSAYVTSTDFNYIRTDFKNDVQFNEFIKSIREKSLYLNDTVPNSKDVILTLSTCSYEFEDARFVVHFKLIK